MVPSLISRNFCKTSSQYFTLGLPPPRQDLVVPMSPKRYGILPRKPSRLGLSRRDRSESDTDFISHLVRIRLDLCTSGCLCMVARLQEAPRFEAVPERPRTPVAGSSSKNDRPGGLVHLESKQLMKMSKDEVLMHASYATDLLLSSAPYLWDHLRTANQRVPSWSVFLDDLNSFHASRYRRLGLQGSGSGDFWPRRKPETKNNYNQGDQDELNASQHRAGSKETFDGDIRDCIPVRSIVVWMAQFPRKLAP
jgi:hypothetical protein